MRYDDVVLKLIDEIPEIEYEYQKELEWWDEEEPGPHIIFGDVLTPFLIRFLENSKETVIIKRIFLFLEKMAASSDELVLEVLACSVLERIGDEIEILNKAYEYMGERCKRLSNEIEKGWERK